MHSVTKQKRRKNRMGMLATIFAFFAIPASIAIHYERSVDWSIQSAFFRNQKWIVDENNPVGRILFYDGPKYLLIALGAYLLINAFKSYRENKARFAKTTYALACLLAVPAIIALGKYLTNEPCPREIYHFGGSLFPDHFFGRCFPGGHASGGFALFFLFWVWDRKPAAALPGLALGSILGAYQMLKGAHFLSDTLLTAAIAWIICLLFWVIAQAVSGDANGKPVFACSGDSGWRPSTAASRKSAEYFQKP